MKDFKSATNRFQKIDKFGQIETDAFSVGFGVIDMSILSSDYNISDTRVVGSHLPEYMYLIPETSGVIIVELAGQSEGTPYTISAAQVTANLGKPILYKVRKVVKAGTTATFSIVW
jgi:hypothetical protein